MPALPGPDGLLRCPWALGSQIYSTYHDDEWGKPLHGDRPLFEKLTLEGFQAGLSWITILKRRDGFREAFDGFDPEIVAAYSDDDVDRLMGDARIIRNQAKIRAAIGNAQALLALESAHGDDALDRLIWSFAPAPRAVRLREVTEVPAKTPESIALSTALAKAGFRFVGPVSMYALMQSGGLVDDHLADCFVATA